MRAAADPAPRATRPATAGATGQRPGPGQQQGEITRLYVGSPPAVSLDMTHLNAIENRQRKSASRDLLFAAFVALATVISISTVTTAVAAASTLAQR